MKYCYLFVCLISIKGTFSQSFSEFDALHRKADSSFRTKNYEIAIKYFERALALPAVKTPPINSSLYYYIARCYSLNHSKTKAIDYLEKSFTTSRAKNEKASVGFFHVATDQDLDFIRVDDRFRHLLNQFFPALRGYLDYACSTEVSYQTVLDVAEYLSKDNSSTDMDPSKIPIVGKTIYYKKVGDSIQYNATSLPFPNVDALKTKILWFERCIFKMNFIWATNHMFFRQHFPYKQLVIEQDCVFEGPFALFGVEFMQPPQIYGTKFRKGMQLDIKLNPDESTGVFALQYCSLTFCSINIENKEPIDVIIENNVGIDSSDFRFTCTQATNTNIANNNFAKKNTRIRPATTNALRLFKNQFNDLIFRCNIGSKFDVLQTSVNGKGLWSSSSIDDNPTSNVDWNSFKDYKLGLYDPDSVPGNIERDGSFRGDKIQKYHFRTGEKLKDISDDQNFKELMGLYSMFVNLYKNRNDIESYNACFIMIKEIQSKRLQYLYETNKTFETFFRWKLSQLLRFYVRYGTDPARAIVISIYIILAFGIFFFFFPSDWDVTSKKRLLDNFRDLIQKNEKGYVLPFFVLAGGFAVSLINSVTLSLNAFITLGFGNIPTHGIARYFCVLEGFIGWFLLSIFTVAMINQVL